jgi:YaiO family outer membrane protein
MRSWFVVAATMLTGVMAAPALHSQGIKLPATAQQRFETLHLGSAVPEWQRGDASEPGESVSFGYVQPPDPYGEQVTGGVYRPLSENLSTLFETSVANLNAGGSEWSVLGQIGTRFGGWGIQAGLRHSEIGLQGAPFDPLPRGSVAADLGTLTFERYFSRYRGAYTFYTGRADDGAETTGHRFRFDYLYGKRSSVGLAYTMGRQLETPQSFGANLNPVDVSNLGVIGEHWFTPSWAVNYDALVEDAGVQGLRPELRLGLRYRF